MQIELNITIQTFDGGYKWSVRTFGNLDEEEEINYRFQKVGAKLSYVCSLRKRESTRKIFCGGKVARGLFHPMMPGMHVKFVGLFRINTFKQECGLAVQGLRDV